MNILSAKILIKNIKPKTHHKAVPSSVSSNMCDTQNHPNVLI